MRDESARARERRSDAPSRNGHALFGGGVDECTLGLEIRDPSVSLFIFVTFTITTITTITSLLVLPLGRRRNGGGCAKDVEFERLLARATNRDKTREQKRHGDEPLEYGLVIIVKR